MRCRRVPRSLLVFLSLRAVFGVWSCNYRGVVPSVLEEMV